MLRNVEIEDFMGKALNLNLGDFTVITGENRSGKTTLLRELYCKARFTPLSTMFYEGNPSINWPDNVEALEEFCAEFFPFKWPDHSTGERKIITLGAALLSQKHDVICIDDLDANLHPKWHRKIVNAIRKVATGAQIIITTNSPHIISMCRPDQLIVLSEGSVVEFDGDPRLMTASDINRAILDIEDEMPDRDLFHRVFRYETLARDRMRDDEEEQELWALRAYMESERVNLRIKPVERVR